MIRLITLSIRLVCLSGADIRRHTPGAERQPFCVITLDVFVVLGSSEHEFAFMDLDRFCTQVGPCYQSAWFVCPGPTSEGTYFSHQNGAPTPGAERQIFCVIRLDVFVVLGSSEHEFAFMGLDRFCTQVGRPWFPHWLASA